MSGSPMTNQSSGPSPGRTVRSYLAAALRIGCLYTLAAVFLMAAVTKITAPADFADRLALHVGLPSWLAWATAAFLPWLELTCGVCLVLGVARREAALLLSLLLLLFLGLAFLRPAADDCGCLVFPRALGPLNVGWGAVLRNLVLLGCGLGVALGRPRTPSLPPALSTLPSRPPQGDLPPLP
jgi:putative oxidoreductase